MTKQLEPPPTPRLPDDFDALVRSGLWHRWSATAVDAGLAAFALGCVGTILVAEEIWLPGLTLLLIAPLLFIGVLVRTRRRYGRDGVRWKEQVAAHIAQPIRWHPVDVWFATPNLWNPQSERMVMLAPPGCEPYVRAWAPRGTAGHSVPGPGWVWGRPRRGVPLVVHIDGRTLWCVGPAYGRMAIAVTRSVAALAAVRRYGLRIDRPGHPIRSSLKPF